MTHKRVSSTSGLSKKKAKRTNHVERQKEDTVPVKKTEASMSETEDILREMLNAFDEQIQQKEECLTSIQKILQDSSVDQAAENFMRFAMNYVEEKRNRSLELVYEINGALRRIAETD
ncbi:uncharacterized protein LOC119398034 [Rhipicephalus sanguineus]|uniref:Uncharacterized protein n=1 Tax=Rhipicephalus sanguineus TaxID=34632 RepID=A0A9D4PPG7_RHISA|nr:uncharacterized protein LOC119398034 [Rhipicephalus sanguineus]KAH7947903.1 hypothetical protein HPB52_016771 [Rhipicephalus sanguineus]